VAAHPASSAHVRSPRARGHPGRKPLRRQEPRARPNCGSASPARR
jgi:hypothetical protein